MKEVFNILMSTRDPYILHTFCLEHLFNHLSSYRTKVWLNSDFLLTLPPHSAVKGATAVKAPKALPRFWVSICSYKKQLVKKNWSRILGLAWLKFTMTPLWHNFSPRLQVSLTIARLIHALIKILWNWK